MTLPIANITSVIQTIITGIYVLLTYLLVRVTKRTLLQARLQSDRENRPYIDAVVMAEEGSPILQLRIGNIGRSAAKNVRLTLSKRFYQFGSGGDQNLLQNKPAFSENIANFSPMLKLHFDLGVAHQIWKDTDGLVTPTRFDLHATYEWEGMKFDETTKLDIDVLLQTSAQPVAFIRN